MSLQRHDPGAREELGAEFAGAQRRRRVIGRAGQRDRQELGEQFGHVALVDHAEPGDDRAFAFAAFAPQGLHPVALHLVDPPAVHQEIDEVHSHRLKGGV